MSDTAIAELALIPANPVALFTDAKQFDGFYDRIREEVSKLTPDLSTDKGRKEIASTAFKVTKTKTALDAAGKLLTEDARKQIDLVNASRRAMWDKLEALAVEVRKPLTEWEQWEKSRVAECERIITELREAAVVVSGETSDAVHARLDNVQRTLLDPDRYQEFLEIAQSAKKTAEQALIAAIARLRQEESDRAELERLRADAEERRLREEEQARQAEEARLEAERAEQERLAVERQREELAMAQAAEAERIAQAADAARMQAIADAEAEAALELAKAEEAARAELAAQEAEAAEVLRLANEVAAAEQKRLQDALHSERAERERERLETERQQAERQRAEQALADLAERQRLEDQARSQDRTHRGQLMGEAKEALMASCGLSEKLAKQVVLSICAGDVPHIRMSF